MIRIPMFLGTCLLGLAFVASTGVSQDKSNEPKLDMKKKGYLPPGWKKLNLSKDQVGKIYDVQGSYRSKIRKLEDEIKELRKHEFRDMVKVLTEAQKADLRRALLDEPVTDKAPPKDKKKD